MLTLVLFNIDGQSRVGAMKRLRSLRERHRRTLCRAFELPRGRETLENLGRSHSVEKHVPIVEPPVIHLVLLEVAGKSFNTSGPSDSSERNTV